MSKGFTVIFGLIVALSIGLTSVLLWRLRNQEVALADTTEQLASVREQLEQAQQSLAQIESNRRSGIDETMELRPKIQSLEQQKQQHERLVHEKEWLRQKLTALQQKLATAETFSSLTSLNVAQPPQVSPNYARPTDNPNPTAKDKLEATICASHLRQIALAASWWARTHENRAPVDLLSLREFLAPMILVCASATPGSVTLGWDKFDPKTISYEVRNPGMVWEGGPSRVFVWCFLHETAGWSTTAPASATASIPSRFVQ
jgi:hypothetical protein